MPPLLAVRFALEPPLAIATMPVTFVALPVSAPTNVVVVSVFVEGLNVIPVPKSTAWLLFEDDATNSGKKLAFVDTAVVATLFAFVAVVAVVALPAVVALVALPVSAPTNVVVDSVLVDGLNVSPVVKSGAWLLFADAATNKG